MSEQQYHWEALRKQRVIDRKYAVMNKSAAEQRQEDEANAHDAARAKLQSEQAMHERRRQLAEQVKQRDREGIQHSYSERESEPSDKTFHYQQGHRTLTVQFQD